MTTRPDWQKYIHQLREENIKLRRENKRLKNARRMHGIALAASPDELRQRVASLEQQLTDSRSASDTYRALLLDFYGFDVDNPPAPYLAPPLRQLTHTIGQVVTADFPGEIVEDADGAPNAMTPNETVVAPLLGMVITEAEAHRDGINPHTPGLTIINSDGDVVSRNPLEEDQ